MMNHWMFAVEMGTCHTARYEPGEAAANQLCMEECLGWIHCPKMGKLKPQTGQSLFVVLVCSTLLRG